MAVDDVQRNLQFGPFELSSRQRVLRRDRVVLPLGGRALDILIYLAERPGEVIAKQELMDHVWSDVTVEEGSLRVHVAAIRKALGDGQFGNRYIANIKGRGYSFVGTVVPFGDGMESKNAKFRQQGRLPVRRRRMIGRETVVSEVSDKLRNERFVTLLGPGGIGKTTVALAVGSAVAEEFGGKVHFVDLESLTDPRHVAGAVATSLGLGLKSKDPGLELVDFVRSRKLLIILDSCEHVIEAVALVAEQLYQETEQVYLLTTSRELLKVEGEHCCQVLPLDFPPDGSEQAANAVLRYPAVQLFVRRVAARAGSVVLADEEAPFVAEMCRKLDGIPLAIELAAGQVAALGLKNTVARLVSRLELLKLSHRTAVPRHRTLKATLDWSYNLLSDGERIVLRRIAPFVGHFTLEGARYVAGELGVGTGEIFDAIAGLVEKSLIATRIDETQAQYRLLDTTRAYALEKLEEHAEVDVVFRRHAEYVTGYLESQRAALLALLKAESGAAYPGSSGNIHLAPKWSFGPRGNNQIATGLAVASTHSSQLGNIRAALEWSFGSHGDDEIATRLAAASTQLFLELSLLIECRIWAERAIVRLGDQHKNSRREMEIYASLSLALMHTEGSSQRVGEAFSRALDVAVIQRDFAYELRLLSGLFMYYRWNIDVYRALDIASRSKEVALKTLDPDDMALAETMLGSANHLAGNHLAALTHFESGLRHSASGSRFRAGHYLFHHSSLLLVGMAHCLLFRGLLDQSLDYARLAIEESEKSDHPATLCRSLSLVLPIYLALADSRRSEQYIAQLTELSAAYSLKPYRAVATGLRGRWLLLQNDVRAGIPLLKRALDELHAQSHEMLNMDFVCDLGAGLIAMGEHQEALTMTERAIEAQHRGGKFLYMPALFRMKGLILASRSAEDCFEAEGSLLSAIDWAKRQSAGLFELKAATDLAELLLKQDRVAEACKSLSAALDRTPAGIVSPTHKRALQILNQLQSDTEAVG
ncbi:ATP-binding protein [Bradyrhizobium erythrophlei]|uniref:Transcriptional regulator n=1 Tax=Bradyrhizobium erythrophlei TaxID=1437360 RepID=A0A1M5YD48_9BRAD|nr:winged helix-turn-helix domain-containing protein [Bradyrhizobium erythrophlei]SHI09804.1 transcriptional regulator [Bradyrhizobium erythrophlei]